MDMEMIIQIGSTVLMVVFGGLALWFRRNQRNSGRCHPACRWIWFPGRSEGLDGSPSFFLYPKFAPASQAIESDHPYPPGKGLEPLALRAFSFAFAAAAAAACA